jgi:Fic family protein
MSIGKNGLHPSMTHTHIWRPIEDLPHGWESSLTNSQTHAMVEVWHEQADDLQKKELYPEFLAKLRRQWSIETGIIEGIYTLSEGATKTLIEKGLDAALLPRSETDDDPRNVVAKIQDHHEAIMGLYEFISGNRKLGTSYVKELHCVLTRHQLTYRARDTLGNEVDRELPHGVWKKLKNNVEHYDGTRFEFCPPEHVDQEMDNLIEMHSNHCEMKVPADIEAAWLHHRFSIIHPFTDGNGRVSRCLATLILLRDNWLPLVITRDDRDKYIQSLRFADKGNLFPLIELFGMLQRKAIREALSLSDQVIQESKAISGILESVVAKFDQRRRAEKQQLSQAPITADSLQLLSFVRLDDVASNVTQVISTQGKGFHAYATDGKRNSEKSKYNYHQIVNCAKTLGYFANMQVYQSWACLIIQTERRFEILFAFHGIGHRSSGVLGCTAMLYTKDYDESGNTTVGDVIALVEEPFEFTYAEDPAAVQRRFQKWQDAAVIKGLNEWQNLI